jgi:hypothetical protein
MSVTALTAFAWFRIVSRNGPGFWEHGIKLPGFIKGGQFLDYLSDC